MLIPSRLVYRHVMSRIIPRRNLDPKPRPSLASSPPLGIKSLVCKMACLEPRTCAHATEGGGVLARRAMLYVPSSGLADVPCDGDESGHIIALLANISVVHTG